MIADERFAEALARHWAGASDSGHKTNVGGGDAAHDLAHVRRVVRASREIGAAEGADMRVLVPAAWLHDLVNLAKDHPERKQASQRSADTARTLLDSMNYPAEHIDGICHAISAHSFSAGIPPETVEAKCLQDADRLDALGAIGIARTFAVGGQLGRPLLDAVDPFAKARAPDDGANSLDHFHTKLLKLPAMMQTAAGRRLAETRAAYLQGFLDQLAREV